MVIKRRKARVSYPFLMEETFPTDNYQDAVKKLFSHPSDFHACPVTSGIRISAVVRNDADKEFLDKFTGALSV